MLRDVLRGAFLMLVLAAPAAAEDAAFASGDFAQAETHYAAALQKNEGDAAASAGLARIRLYQERLADARRLATQALAADPENALAKKVIAGVDGREASLAPGVYSIAMPQQGATIPFVATDPLPVLKVEIGGRSVYFLIDTGAPDLAIDKDFAAELGLKSADAGQGTFAGGQHAAVLKSQLPEIAIGEVRVRGVPVVLMPVRGFALKPGIRLDGIVGTGFLRHFLATLDYPHGALILRPRSDSAAFEADAARKGATVVPMWLTGDHFLFARARIGAGFEGLFNIDTGLAGAGMQATKATLDAAHIVLDESRAQTGQGGGGMVRSIPFRADASLGSLTVRGVDGIYTPDGDQFGIFPFQVGGTLSHGFFRQHALTFDFSAMRLVVI